MNNSDFTIDMDLSRHVSPLTRYMSKRWDKILYPQDRILSRYKRDGREGWREGRVSQRRRLHALNYVSHQLPVAIFQNYNIVRRSPVSSIMYASRRIILVRRGKTSMPAANWPKLENKRNTAGINVEDAREGDTPVHKELFAARITLHLSRLKPLFDSLIPLYAYAHRHCLEQKISSEHLSRASPSPESWWLRKEELDSRNSLMVEIFVIFGILL